MRNHLNSLTQIISAAFFVNNTFVDTSRSDVIGLRCLYTQETFVMSQVEIGFMSVYGNIAFSMLIRVQSSRVDVDVRVKLLDGYIITSCLQQFTDGR